MDYRNVGTVGGTDPPNPKIEITELREDLVKFYLLDADTSVANSLRRVMIGEVPTMAIDLVEIQENSTVLHDEFLSHRLGLIPLRVESDTGVDSFCYKRDCTCDDSCPSCSVKFSLDVTHTGVEDVKIVYSSDLICEEGSTKVVPMDFVSAVEEQQMVGEHSDSEGRGIAICKLGRGQRLKLVATAVKGIARIHAKWSPVCNASFAYEADIRLNHSLLEMLNSQQRDQFVEACPTKVFSIDQRQQKIVVDDSKRCMFCDECSKLSETWKMRKDDDAFVMIKFKPKRYLFTVETTGALDPEEVVFAGLKTLRNKLELLSEKYDTDMNQDEDLIEAAMAYTDTGGFI